MNEQSVVSNQMQTARFLLVVDPLPLRFRSLSGTALPVTAAAVTDLAQLLSGRAAILSRLAYILAENAWELSFTTNFMFEARCICRQIDVERMLAAHPDLALAASVYLEEPVAERRRYEQHELFWAEDECRLVAA